jgi:hypothetical protein
MQSDLDILSNLMIDDESHKPEIKYLPGDFLVLVYPEKVDKRCIESELTPKQILEYEQYLTCNICKRPCAGTCQTSITTSLLTD